MKVVIPSRGRAQTIGAMTLALLPHALVCVEESEVDAYHRAVPDAQLLPHPPLPGLPAIRNWILDALPDEVIFMLDDDIEVVYSMVGKNPQAYRREADILQIIENAALVAGEIGAGLFGFSQSGRPWAFTPQDPLHFDTWVGTAIGVIGKQMRWDTRFALRGDVDFSLQQLLEKRVVYVDTRFFFFSRKRLKASGGSTAFRSSERDQQEMAYLRHKWGRFVELRAIQSMGSGKARQIKSKAILTLVRRRQ